MENKLENTEIENWDKKIESQNDEVKKLEETFTRNPSEALRLELDRAIDTLRHYINAAYGETKERAGETAEYARQIALNKAIQQLPLE